MGVFHLLAQANNSGGAGGAAVGGAFVGIWCLFVLVALALGAFTIWMLIDVLSSNRPTNEKLLWAVVIILTSGLGAVLYFFIARGKTAGGA